MVRKALLIASLCVTAAFCDQVAVSDFKGLNNDEANLVIGSEYAQDLLNVDVSAGGKSVVKRPGFGQYKDIDEGALHGGHHFFDSTGNDVQVWGSSKSLTGIVADGTPTVLISSATQGATWDCADTVGFAYCVNSSRDVYVRTTGAAIAWQTSPLGTMIEATPDRMVVAGVAAAPSSLYVSAANSFLASGYTVGSLNSDAFIEPITAPGSKLTHIRWGCGKLLWWKDQSFGYTQFEDQYTLENKIVSDTIGTFDNTSAIDPGGNVWFRGQDGHIYRYDCSGLTKESIEITPNIQSSGRRTSNSFIQTTLADWNGGSGNPPSAISTTTITDSITPTTFTVTENSSASGWGSGSTSNATVWTSSVSLATNNSGTVTDNSFENANIATAWTVTNGSGDSGWISVNTVTAGANCNPTPQSGSRIAQQAVTSGDLLVQTVSVDGNTVYDQGTVSWASNSCTWVQRTLTVSDANKGKRFRLRFKPGPNNSNIITQDSYILGGNITFYTATDQGSALKVFWIDNVESGSSTITSGQFTSQAFNTGTPYSFVYTSATWTAVTSTPSIVLQKGPTATGPWLDINNSTGTNVQTNHRFLRYLSSFTIEGGDARGYLSGVQIIAKSSGPYYSAVKNAPNITAWSTFNPTPVLGDGTIIYNIRRATQPFTVLSSTPSGWTQLTENSLITASTGTYFQVIASFTITAATNTAPSLSDFTVNWYEGNASDQAYMHYFDNAIWTSVAFGVGVSSNTHIFKRDLINDGWTVYNFGAGGFLTQNNRLYFGDVSDGGKIFLYGSGTSDNGAAINAYWQSKEFAGSDPFMENQLTQIDTIVRRDPNQSLVATYTVGTSTATSYTISLSSTTTSIITHRKTLPSGKNGYSFNMKYSDNSTTGAFEILGYRLGFIQYPWKPSQ